MSTTRIMATLVVTAAGADGDAIAGLADRHAAIDPERRRVIRAEELRAVAPAADNDDAAAVVIIDCKGEICGVLDRRKALCEAWIEHAFLRAQSGAEQQTR